MTGVSRNVTLTGIDEVFKQLQRVNAAATNPDPFLRVAVPHFKGAIIKNFDEGGPGWAAKADGSASRLQKTGRLRDSFQFRVDRGVIRIFTSVIYASTHQFGAAKGSFALTSFVVRAHARKGTKGVRAHIRADVEIPWGDIPPRPFMKIDADEKETGVKIIADAMRKFMEGG